MGRKKPDIATAIILEKRVTDKDGLHPVKLRITYQRRRKYYAVKGEHYSVDGFSAVTSPVGRGKNKEKRKTLEAIENRAIEIIDDVLVNFSFEAFEREYLSHKVRSSTVADFFEDKTKELDEANKVQTAILYRSTLISLLKFDPKITFQKITPGYLEKYQKWMIEQENSYTTIGMYMRNLKHIVNRAIDARIIGDYPFGDPKKGKYKIPDGKNKKKALTLKDIEKLFSYTPTDKNEYLALNYWILSYLSNGMNMIDIANLRYKDLKGDNIEFIRQKTRDTSKEVPVIRVYRLKEIDAIIKKLGNSDRSKDNYIFPIFLKGDDGITKHKKLQQHIKQTNKYIRRIAENVGITTEITTYWARHSYSTILKRSGAPIEFISEQLGHQSTKVTRHYLDSFEDEHRERFSTVLLPQIDGKKTM